MVRSLCSYRDALGVPGEGFHKTRFYGFALYDILGTIGIAAVIAYFYPGRRVKVFFIALLLLMILAIFLHRLFCVNTTLNKMIFGKI